METVNIISAIIIYFVLPVIVIFGVIIIFRRKREKEAGHIGSVGKQKLNKDDVMHDMMDDEAREARHTKTSPRNIDPETGNQPDEEKL